MRYSRAAAIMAQVLTLGGALIAQDQPPPVQEPAGVQPPERELRALEMEMVGRVQALLAREGAAKPPTQEKKEDAQPRLARPPEPDKPERQALRHQLSESKRKSLLMLDIFKEQRLAELEKEKDAQVKKLLEKFKKQERLVINPVRRPNPDREREQLQEQIDREIEGIERRFELERGKVERESRQEKERLENFYKQLEKKLPPDEEQEGRQGDKGRRLKQP